MKLVSSLFKEQPLAKQLKSINLLTNNLTTPFLAQSLRFYLKSIKNNQEEELIKFLLKTMQEKSNVSKKIKVLTLWIEMFKITKYDLSDILMNKKLKIFTKTAVLKQPLKASIDKQNLQEYLLVQILVPLYNYFMKLSLNQDLYKHCNTGKVPDNQVFRRGTKIRYIWVFKIYNLINVLISIVASCCKIIKSTPKLISLQQITKLLYADILSMNNFVIQALEQGSEDNFLLMPYFDMLQFYQSIQEQKSVSIKIYEIYTYLKELEHLIAQEKIMNRNLKVDENGKIKQKNINKEEKVNAISGEKIGIPRVFQIDQQVMEEIQTQALKVKLISCTLKNPRKNYTNLQTEYNDKLNVQRNRTIQHTSENEERVKTFDGGCDIGDDFMEKYRNLD